MRGVGGVLIGESYGDRRDSLIMTLGREALAVRGVAQCFCDTIRMSSRAEMQCRVLDSGCSLLGVFRFLERCRHRVWILPTHARAFSLDSRFSVAILKFF